jgi:Cytochrome bd terminal oxidase subunit I
LLGNSYLWNELIHMYVAAYIVVAFIVAGWYALWRLRGRWTRYERTALTTPLTIAALAAPVQILVGDWEVARFTDWLSRREAASVQCSCNRGGVSAVVGTRELQPTDPRALPGTTRAQFAAMERILHTSNGASSFGS